MNIVCVVDLALNVDNVFQADDCDAFDSNVDNVFQADEHSLVAHPHPHQQHCLIHLQETATALHPMLPHSPEHASTTS
ncbi:hypothetical protein Tco_0498175, partial [Tanacetum coccineum]